MKKLVIAAVCLLVGTVACSKSDNTSVDSALSMGAATVPFDSLSAIEQAQGQALVAPSSGAATRPAGTTVRRSGTSTSSGTAARRTSGSSGTSGTAASSSGGTTIQKNTKRDAAIGAAAGAVIGATTSKDKVKGAVVGGVVGGVIGGVIGNNVDVKKKKN